MPRYPSFGHYIDGAADTGGTRSASVFNPATGADDRDDAPRRRKHGRARCRGRESRLPELGRHAAAETRARAVPASSSCSTRTSTRSPRSSRASTARCSTDAKGELTRGIEIVEFACGIPQLLKGQHSDNVGGGIDNWSLRQPVGVCAGITPFNFPAMVPMWMFPLAIACGNTFVLKPSERDPSTSLKLAQLFEEAGLPNGVLNVVQGDKEAVDALLAPPRRRGRQLRRLDGRRRAHLHRRALGTANACRRSAAPRTTWSCMPDADLEQAADALDRRRLRLGRRALHGDLGRRRRRQRCRRARREARGADSRADGRRRQRRRAPTWGR